MTVKCGFGEFLSRMRADLLVSALRVRVSKTLLEICAQGADKIFRSPGSCIGCVSAFGENLKSDVALDHFGHQGIHGPSTG